MPVTLDSLITVLYYVTSIFVKLRSTCKYICMSCGIFKNLKWKATNWRGPIKRRAELIQCVNQCACNVRMWSLLQQLALYFVKLGVIRIYYLAIDTLDTFIHRIFVCVAYCCREGKFACNHVAAWIRRREDIKPLQNAMVEFVTKRYPPQVSSPWTIFGVLCWPRLR